MNSHNLVGMLVFVAYATTVIFALLWYRELLRRSKEKTLMDDTAKNIVEAKGEVSRHRWINDDTMEYLYLVLGTESRGGQDLVWAIVRVGRESTTVTIQHLELALLRVDSRQMVTDCAADLVRSLKKLGYEAKIEAVKGHPDHEMLHAKD